MKIKIIINVFLLILLVYTFDYCNCQQDTPNKNVEVKSDTVNGLSVNKVNVDEKNHHEDHDHEDDDDHDHDEHKKNKDKNHHDSVEDSSSEEKKDKHKDGKVTQFGFIHAFFASISVIVVSEIGDKTFFIAAIMAMKHSRFIVYAGAMFALGFMTLLSALLGNIVTKIIPRSYTYYASSILFAIFGVKMLREGLAMDKNENANEEYEEAQQSLKKSEEEENMTDTSKNLEAGIASNNATAVNNDENCKWMSFTRKFVVSLRKYISPIFLQAFILTFLAEWGDRSQISTIILGARENMIGTIIGGTIGHAICTGMAVIGGRFIAQHISIRNVTLCGAFVFLFFACSAFFIGPDTD